MVRLINDLLDAASIEAGNLSIERRPRDAFAFAADACDRLEPLALTRNITIQRMSAAAARA
jgi:signal transduction histidine kinase